MTDTTTTPTTVHLTIDGVQIEAEPGELLIKAAQRAGVFIPRFCYHERMKPVGMCRACLVEIEGVRGLPPACTTPVADGMVVHFHQENVAKAHEGVLEFLLVNHPLDCPVCDRGGECPLQDQVVAFGPGESRFTEEKRHWEKPIPLSDLVLLDRERCIQCARCTRFADEIAGDPLIQFIERGGHTEINTFPDEPFSSYFSGNVVQICPVGALTSSSYRFKARPWDLQTTETTCDGCAVGCREVADTSGNRLLRVLGVDSDPVNQGWLCDKGRYGLEFTAAPERLSTPLVSEGGVQRETSWPEALQTAAQLIQRAVELHGPDAVAVLGGSEMTNEDLFAWKRFVGDHLGSSLIDTTLGDGLPAAAIAQLPRATINDLDSARAIVMLAPDPKEELPVLALRLRRAATELGVPLIELSATRSGIASDATVIPYLPGEATVAAARAAAVITGTLPVDDALTAVSQQIQARTGSIVVVAGRPSIAESVDCTLAALGTLLALPETKVLPAARSANAMGAVELGICSAEGPAAILERCARGAVHVLITLGSDAFQSAPDHTVLTQALSNVGSIVAVGAFPTGNTSRAAVVLPTTVWGEQRGTITNIEGRVQPVAPRLSAVLPVLDPWRIANELATRCGMSMANETDASQLTDAIAQDIPRFAGVTDDVVMRARDGVVLPFDPARTEWRAPGVGSTAPSWEPIPPAPLPDSSESTPIEGSDGTDAVGTLSESEQALSERISELPATPPAPALPPFVAPNAPNVPPRDAYSLRLVSHHLMYDGSPRVAASPSVSGLAATAHLRVNPSDMARLGTTENEIVRVTSARGSISIPVRTDARVPEGVAFIPAGTSDAGVSGLIDHHEVVTDVRLESRA